MANTVQNQTIYHINRDMPKKNEGNFILVKKENLERAMKELTPYGAILFLYLIGNADGYDLAFSPQDVINRTGIGKTSVHTYVKKMKEKGYLVKKSGNVYDFFEVPQETNKIEFAESCPSSEQNSSRGGNDSSQGEQGSPQGNIEIYNKDIKDNITVNESKTKFIF